MLLINTNNQVITKLLGDREFLLMLTIVLLTFTKTTHGNILQCHRQVQVCIPPQNNEATFSCCNQNSMECEWVREGNLAGSFVQQNTSTGLKLTLQSLPDFYGQYNCLYRNERRIAKQILFIPSGECIH